MFTKLILLCAVFIIIFIGFRHWRQLPAARQREWLTRVVGIIAVSILVVLVLSGRLHWLLAVLGTVALLGFKSIAFLMRHGRLMKRVAATLLQVPVLRRIPILRRLAGILFDSTIQTRYLTVNLDAATGRLHGQIRLGRHQGVALDQLTLNDLIGTLSECRLDDRESAALLAAYLDQRFGVQWRVGRTDEYAPNGPSSHSGVTPMSREEALSVLGLDGEPSIEEIRHAHRRLIQKLHPDRGGTDYLATKINQAKDLLMPKNGV